MAAHTLAGLFQVGVDILKTTIVSATKRILAQTGSVVGKTVDSDNVEWWQHVGFASRPTKPVAGKAAAQGFVVRDGSHDVIIASQDDRGRALYGALDDGETCVYAAGADGNSQGRILLKKDGGVTVYTTKGNTASGTSVAIQANPDGSINLASEYGAIQISSSGITCIATSGAGFKADASGFTIIGTQLGLNAGTVSLGAGAATGVATQLTQLPVVTAHTADAASMAVLLTALATWLPAAGAILQGVATATAPQLAAESAANTAATSAATAAAATATALAAALPLPTNYSQSVKAAM